MLEIVREWFRNEGSERCRRGKKHTDGETKWKLDNNYEGIKSIGHEMTTVGTNIQYEMKRIILEVKEKHTSIQNV